MNIVKRCLNKKMCDTDLGRFRNITSGDGRKDFDTDVLDELDESIDAVED